MGVIVLHAGMAKTGSSSVQQWLASNGATLASERDIHPMRIAQDRPDSAFDVVPCTESQKVSKLAGVQEPVNDPQLKRAPSSLRDDARQMFDRLDSLAQTRGTIVLSSEAYQLPFWRGDEMFLAMLDEFASVHPVRVAYYVRPQHTAMEAAWRQWGFRVARPPSMFLDRRMAQYRYFHTLLQIRQLAPHVSFEMRAFRDDLLEGGDVVADFVTTFLGADALRFSPAQQRRANRGIPLDLVILLREGKDRFWSWRGDNDALDRLREVVTRWDIPESEQAVRSRRVLQGFCHRHLEPGNRRLIAELGWDTQCFVPPVDAPGADGEADFELEELDELWSSNATETVRELVFCALTELLSSMPREAEAVPAGAPVKET